MVWGNPGVGHDSSSAGGPVVYLEGGVYRNGDCAPFEVETLADAPTWLLPSCLALGRAVPLPPPQAQSLAGQALHSTWEALGSVDMADWQF